MTISLILKIYSIVLISIIIIIIISSTLINFIHPLILILILVIYTIINLLLIFLLTRLSIYIYIIFISIVGGIIIIFLYFTRIINNYPSKIKINESFIVIFIFIIIGILVINSFSSDHIEFYLNNKFNFNNILIYKIYLYPLRIITVLTIFNLLYCLILTIKICSSKYLPLRKINYEKI